MIIGVMQESQPGEARVPATPATAAQLIKLGYDVVVEPGAAVAGVADTRASPGCDSRTTPMINVVLLSAPQPPQMPQCPRPW